MVTVHVKHYLTPEGLHYFASHWYPQVEALVHQQPGFVSISHQLDKWDCVTIALRFKDDKTIQAWFAHPAHKIIKELDPYRSRDYFEAVLPHDDATDPATLQWQRY